MIWHMSWHMKLVYEAGLTTGSLSQSFREQSLDLPDKRVPASLIQEAGAQMNLM